MTIANKGGTTGLSSFSRMRALFVLWNREKNTCKSMSKSSKPDMEALQRAGKWCDPGKRTQAEWTYERHAEEM